MIDLDVEFLARRLAERGVAVEPSALTAAVPAAWRRYDELVDPASGHPWHELVGTLLRGAGIDEARAAPLVDWLWAEQPRANLWRGKIPDMIALARELTERGVRVAVLSNSEGRLAELLGEIGIVDAFAAVIDSGRIGIEKPDRRIFDHALEVLGASAPGIHIGDSWPADIVGALGAGWRAIWFGRRATAVDEERESMGGGDPAGSAGGAGGKAPRGVDDPRVAIARDAAGVRDILTRWLEL